MSEKGTRLMQEAFERQCDRRGCPKEGTHHPILLVVMPVGMPDYTGQPVEMTIGVRVCPEHQDGMTAEDFVSDEGWAQIMAAFKATNKLPPERATLGLAWRRVDMGPTFRGGRLIEMP